MNSDELKARLNRYLEQAAAAFRQAARSDPSMHEAYTELGISLSALDCLDEAVESLNRDPSPPREDVGEKVPKADEGALRIAMFAT